MMMIQDTLASRSYANDWFEQSSWRRNEVRALPCMPHLVPGFVGFVGLTGFTTVGLFSCPRPPWPLHSRQ